MKKFFKFYLARAVLIGSLAILQLALILGCVCCAFCFGVPFRIFLLAASLFTALKISSSYDIYPCKTGWIIGLLALPMIFLPLFFLFGRGKVMEKIQKFMSENPLETHSPHTCSEDIPPYICQQFTSVSRKGGFGVYTDTKCRYLADGGDIFEYLKKMLNSAENYIFMEFFILAKGFMWGETLEILKRKAAEGVKIYILMDDLGTICLLPWNYTKKLKSFGIECRRHNAFMPKITPAVNYRDHRKIVVCDGRLALTCGANIADEYINKISPYGLWKDTGVYLEGQGAQGFAAMFVQMWNLNGGDLSLESFPAPKHKTCKNCGTVMPFGDIPSRRIEFSETVFLNMINTAVKTVYITTPYLIPDEEISSALCRAAQRGVDVRIIAPLIPDKRYIHIMTRQSYIPLLRSGVKIYEYTPGFIHAKSILCDGKLAYIGSANLDLRSLYLHFESGALIYDDQCCIQLGEDLTKLFKISREIDENDKVVQAASRSLLGKILRLISPLL